ncbi:MAG: translocation/assembly module TamB domain-containing protein, partial [Acidobacteria bacterium]|nr:translocation/assembly module TamB domain-containing protein [Acidobacteriota bacterium]
GSVDLTAVGDALDLSYGAASRADGYLRATWPGLEYKRAEGDARITLAATRPSAARGVAPIAGVVNIRARSGQVLADVQALRALGLMVDGRLSLSDYRGLGGRLTARAADLDGLVAAAEAFLGRPRGSLLGTPVGGAATVTADLGGTVSEPAVSATLQAPAVSVGAATGIAVDGGVRYSPTAVTVDELNVKWEQASVQASGLVGLTGRQPLALTVAARQTRIESVLAALERADVPASGVVSIDGEVAGTVTNPTANVAVQASELSAYGEVLGTMTADARLANRQIDLTQLRLVKPQPDGDGILTASASYDLRRQRYSLAIDGERLQLVNVALADGTPIHGTLTINGSGAGTVSDPAAKAQIVADGVRLRDDDLGRFALEVDVANREAWLRARADRFRLSADARIGTSDPYPTRAEIVLDDLDLAVLPLGDDVELTGRVRATASGSANLTEPRAGSGEAIIQGLQATWKGQPVTVEGPATIRYANDRVAIDRLLVKAQGSSVLVNGELPVDPREGQGALNLDARLDLAALAPYASDQPDLEVGGTAALAGTIQGSLSAIDPNLVLTVENASVTTPALQPGLSDFRARIEVSGGELRVPIFSGQWGPARIDATARAPFDLLPETLPVALPRPGGPTQLSAHITKLDLSTLPNSPDRLGGSISLRADIQAPRPDLAAVTGQVTFPDLTLRFDTLDLAQEGTSTVAIADGAAEFERFALAGSAGRLEVRGGVGLIGDRALDVTAGADLNIAALAAFTDAVRAEGKTVLELGATGTVANPNLAGFLELSGGSVSLDEPQIVAQQLDARVDFTRDRADIRRLSGTLNGGTISGSGFVAAGDGDLPAIDLQLAARDVAFEAPLDLRSLSDTDLTITRRDNTIVVGGGVKIQEAGLTADLNLDTGILAALNARRSLDLTEERSPVLERVRFDLGVATTTPIVVDNNLATAEITADLRVLGTPYETGMSGRLQLLDGSTVTLNERRYEVERGIITFLDDRRILPSFDLRLNTSARSYDIALEVMGSPGDTETTLTSTPSLPEPDIMALLVTGRTLDEMRGEEFEVAQEQVMSQLVGRVGSTLGGRLERATGLSTVRVEPNLIANEADPSARLTIGQNLTDDLRLIYSTDLVDSSDRIWVGEYDLTRRFHTRVVRQGDDSYRFDFQHDVRFGGRPEPRRQARSRRTVGKISITGDTANGEADLRKVFGVESGDEFDFFEVRRGIEKVEETYRERGRLQSRVKLARTTTGDSVDLSLAIAAGPQVELSYEGFAPPSDVQEEIRRRWHQGVFDTHVGAAEHHRRAAARPAGLCGPQRGHRAARTLLPRAGVSHRRDRRAPLRVRRHTRARRDGRARRAALPGRRRDDGG